jgi:hypothetical protein
MIEPRVAKKGEPVKAYGWIMNWEPYRTVEKKKFGDEIAIKTIFRRKVGDEMCSVYIGNVLIRDLTFMETIKMAKNPIPVLIQGKKRGEHVYNNVYRNEIENTKKIVWIFMLARGLDLKIVDPISKELLDKTGVSPPPMTFKRFMLNTRPINAAMKRKKRTHPEPE